MYKDIVLSPLSHVSIIGSREFSNVVILSIISSLQNLLCRQSLPYRRCQRRCQTLQASRNLMYKPYVSSPTSSVSSVYLNGLRYAVLEQSTCNFSVLTSNTFDCRPFHRACGRHLKFVRHRSNIGFSKL